jgi:release factor glutamine methyltransferase
MGTIGELLADAVSRLHAAGSETARLDAEVLLAWVLTADRTGLLAHPEREVAPEAAGRFDDAVRRRATGEPVAYIRGIKEFFGLAFAVDPRALIPRPETELLVEAGRAAVVERLIGPGGRASRGPVRVVDVGTGGGAVAISLAVELGRRGILSGRDVDIVATDTSTEALGLARENAVAHAVGDVVRFVESDLLPAHEADGGPFEVILANLPYVMSGAIAGLPVAASFEPRHALDGGADGLDVVRRLLARLPDALAPDGVALLEIGADQGETAQRAALAVLPGWRTSVETDLAGLPRLLRVERETAR